MDGLLELSLLMWLACMYRSWTPVAPLRERVKFHTGHDSRYRVQRDIRRIYRKGRLSTRRDRVYGQRFPVWRYTLESARCQLVSKSESTMKEEGSMYILMVNDDSFIYVLLFLEMIDHIMYMNGHVRRISTPPLPLSNTANINKTCPVLLGCHSTCATSSPQIEVDT